MVPRARRREDLPRPTKGATRAALIHSRHLIRSLSDDLDCPDVPTAECYLEGSRTNIEVVGRALLEAGYDAFSSALLKETFGIMGAEHQAERLNALGSWLQTKSPLPCCLGLSIRIHKTPHECERGADAGYSHSFNTPSCVLRPGGSITVSWPVDKQIDQHGPYDAESFPDKRVKIAVVCPEEFVGESQFLRQFKDGLNLTTLTLRSSKGSFGNTISTVATLRSMRSDVGLRLRKPTGQLRWKR